MSVGAENKGGKNGQERKRRGCATKAGKRQLSSHCDERLGPASERLSSKNKADGVGQV